MRKGYLFIFLVITFLCSGCSVKYELDIDRNLNFQENVNLNATSDTDIIQFKNFKLYIPLDINADDYAVYENRLDGVSYYQTSKNDNNIKFRGKFSYDSFSNSTIVNNAFDYISLTKVNDLFVVSSSTGFKLFDSYSNLDDVTIIIKSKAKLIETNADLVEKHKYTWYINKENANLKRIYLKFDRIVDDRTIFEKIQEGEFLNIFTLTLGVFLIGGIIFLILKKKGDRKNKI